MTSIASVILEADINQSRDSGHRSNDLTIHIEGGHAFRGHVSLDTMTDLITVWERLDIRDGHPGRPATTTVRLNDGRDGGVAEIPVHFPLTRVLFVHYSERL